MANDCTEASGPGSEGPPTELGRYRIVQRVGQGAFSQVYFARDRETLAPLALKVLREDIDPSIAEQVRIRFLAEEKISKAIAHPSIVNILTTSEPGVRPCFIAMEFVAGVSFSEHLRRLSQPSGSERPSRAAFLMEVARLSHQVAAAMARAHAKGIVHRDLKPDNVLVVRDADDRPPSVRILDFGIAKAPVELFSMASAPSVTRYWTELGTVMGSLPFMAPEQNGAAHDVTGQADVFALGVMLFVSLFGAEGRLMETSGRELEPTDLERAIAVSPPLPTAWEGLVRRMLERDPKKRPSMGEVAIRLQRLARADDAFGAAVEGFIRRGRVPRARQLVRFLNWAETADYLTEDELLFLKRAPVHKLKSYRRATASALLMGGIAFGSAALIGSLAWQHDAFVRFKSRVQEQQAKEAQRVAELEQ
ncbi:MAG TPA: serine/threonine-protein kinase, partial [Polyangiaceae bacterium]|nr:serine/threonine-protein kinase [Polyangiaceae bacterium]